MKQKYLFVAWGVFQIFALTYSKSAFSEGADGVGNGGDVLVCPGKQPGETRYELVDYYEGKVLRNIEPDLGPPTLSFEEKVEFVLRRLEVKAPNRANKYRVWFNDFLGEASFPHGIKLVDVPDTTPLVIPAGCEVRQAAVQLKDWQLLPGLTRYTFDGDIWDQLDSTQKAGLILHELVYREAMEYGHSNSLMTRYLNSLIGANGLKDYQTDKALHDLFKQLQFGFVDLSGMWIMIKKHNSLKFHPNGMLAEAKYYTLWEGQFPVRDGMFSITEGGSVSLYTDGRLKSYNVPLDRDRNKKQMPVHLDAQGVKIEFISGLAEFREDGTLEYLRVQGDSDIGRVVMTGRHFKIDIWQASAQRDSRYNSSVATFYSTGIPKGEMLVKACESWIFEQNEWRPLFKIELNPDGTVKNSETFSAARCEKP